MQIPVVTSVSHATRPTGSSAKTASRIASGTSLASRTNTLETYLLNWIVMDRREFLRNSIAAVALSQSAQAAPLLDEKKRRVGLIGCGWYGKIDLLRLIQIAPVEVVSLCDVDSRMLADAAAIVAQGSSPVKRRGPIRIT